MTGRGSKDEHALSAQPQTVRLQRPGSRFGCTLPQALHPSVMTLCHPFPAPKAAFHLR